MPRSHSAVITFLLISTVSSILLELTSTTETKCFLAQLSPDKTLEAKFGILRTTKEECQVRMTITIIDDKGDPRQVLHDRQHSCYQTKTNDPVVIKHTSPQLQYDGRYELCVEAIDIRSPTLLVQLFMGERLNPALYHNQLGQLPLVESAQLIELQSKIQAIKRMLVKLGIKFEESRLQGDKFDSHSGDILSKSKIIALIHFALVVIFGTIWVYLVKQLKRQH